MNKKVFKLCLTTLMIALCYIGFAFIRFTIPTPLGYTSFHLGNVFCLLASLLLGGTIGGVAGAIGMGIGDMLDPLYIAIAPKTIILKMIMGLVCGLFAHKLLKIDEYEGKRQIIRVALSSLSGALINVILEPTFGYFYYRYVLNAPEKALSALLSFNLLSTSINAILAIILSTILYIAISKRFKNSMFLKNLYK